MRTDKPNQAKPSDIAAIDTLFTIGQAAKASGVSAKMIRYYESIAVIPAAQRTEAGYRLYSKQEIHTLQFVRRARDLGFALDAVKKLVSLWHNQGRSSAEVKALALEHIQSLEVRILAMQSMAKTLSELASACHGDQRPDCPILSDLAGGSLYETNE